MKKSKSVERFEVFLRDFEWNWTKAVLVSLALSFAMLLSAAVLPSFWLYYAEGELGWSGPTDLEATIQALDDPFEGQFSLNPIEDLQNLNVEIGKQIRDAIGQLLTILPFVALFAAGAVMQNWRRRLRGETGDKRPTGGYR